MSTTESHPTHGRHRLYRHGGGAAGHSLLLPALGEAGTVTILMVALLGGSAWIYLYSYLVFIGKMK